MHVQFRSESRILKVPISFYKLLFVNIEIYIYFHVFDELPKNLNFLNEALINKFSSSFLCDVLVDQILEQVNHIGDVIFLKRE